MITEQLKAAIRLINEGKLAPARELLLQELKADPENLDAWVWALEAAASDKERRSITLKILRLDPSHQGALAALNDLDQKFAVQSAPVRDQQQPGSDPPPRRVRSFLAGLLNLGLDWATSLPAGCSFTTILLGIILGVFIYTRVNTSLFGLTGANLENLSITNSYERIASEDYSWELQFEGLGKTRYQGTVRHVAPIRIKEFAILTHDILVTSGDFSDPDVVNTNVIDHKFFWRSPNSSEPSGKINLIHAVPATKEIYQQMLEIRKWDSVLITGREILNVKAFENGEDFIGAWKDYGCNTLLVESVTILSDNP